MHYGSEQPENGTWIWNCSMSLGASRRMSERSGSGASERARQTAEQASEQTNEWVGIDLEWLQNPDHLTLQY